MNDHEKIRKAIDDTVTDIEARVAEMFKAGIPLRTCYRLAISWELEVATYRSVVEYTKQLSEKENEKIEQLKKRFMDNLGSGNPFN